MRNGIMLTAVLALVVALAATQTLPGAAQETTPAAEVDAGATPAAAGGEDAGGDAAAGQTTQTGGTTTGGTSTLPGTGAGPVAESGGGTVMILAAAVAMALLATVAVRRRLGRQA